jgi:hypothetical protein
MIHFICTTKHQTMEAHRWHGGHECEEVESGEGRVVTGVPSRVGAKQ